MVFESLINPRKAERRPWEMLFIGFLYSTVGIFLAYWIFKEYSSLVMVFLTVLASFHFVHAAIDQEEEKDKQDLPERILIKEHGRALSYLMFLFVGFTFSFMFWKLALPDSMTSVLYHIQEGTISNIQAKFTGAAISASQAFLIIFANNLRVLFFSLLFSFFYGAGAIFILSWNASVIGTAMANFMEALLHEGVFSAFSVAFLRYFTHGIPEVLAYFTGALAGGIISVAIIRHDFNSKRFREILIDSIDLIVLSVIILILAGILEVYVTPALI